MTAQGRLGEPELRKQRNLAWLGDRAAVIVGDENCAKNTLLLYAGSGQSGAQPLSLTAGCGGSVSFADKKIAAATVPSKFNEYIQWDEPASLLVTLYDAEGLTPLWQSKLGVEVASKRDPLIAMSPERMLVLWKSRMPQADEQPHLAVLSLRDGKTVGAKHGRRDNHPLREAATIFDGEQFLIALRTDDHHTQGQGRLLLLRLDSSGALRERMEVGGPGTDHPALVRTATGVALAFIDARGLQLYQFPRGGKPSGSPSTVSAGVSISANTPKLAALGGLVAVAWPDVDRFWTAVVDESGNISPPLPLSHGGVIHSAVLAASDNGYTLAQYTYLPASREFSIFTEALACREDAQPGPPARILP